MSQALISLGGRVPMYHIETKALLIFRSCTRSFRCCCGVILQYNRLQAARYKFLQCIPPIRVIRSRELE